MPYNFLNYMYINQTYRWHIFSPAGYYLAWNRTWSSEPIVLCNADSFFRPHGLLRPLEIWAPMMNHDGFKSPFSSHHYISGILGPPLQGLLACSWLRHDEKLKLNWDQWSFSPGPILVTWLGLEAIVPMLKEGLIRIF